MKKHCIVNHYIYRAAQIWGMCFMYILEYCLALQEKENGNLEVFPSPKFHMEKKAKMKFLVDEGQKILTVAARLSLKYLHFCSSL